MRKFSLYHAKGILLFLALLMSVPALAWDAQKKVVLQAYWWDYWNGNFPNSYANYLTELAPRLHEMDINAVWVPPFYKNTGTNSVGYAPFDHYDLGDKYQKGFVTTRFGTKDDVLRMIAVMHANGIEVIADVVLNHVNGADAEDPMGRSNKWKTFRYACYKTPDGTDYLAREGRWPKNWQNFHPNDSHDTEEGNWCAGWWGPDICYYEGAYGQSSNATYNPEQGPNYMRDQARDWIVWFKKQTAVDGFRWDAVKHFPEYVQQDLSWNVKYAMPGDWCAGGEAMFNVGEFLGSKSEVDGYTSTVTTSNGGNEFLMGGFDCPLRESIKNIVDGGGYSNVSGVVTAQLDSRFAEYAEQRVHRSVNYVNSHDTFRPTFDDQGNYNGWDSGNETGGHIDPFNERLPMAYALAASLDGNLCVYIEDLFNLSNSNRWTHHPANEEELPARDAIVNMIWCHQNLDFKYGDYKVRHQSEDLLVIERSGRAIIAITDNGASDQEVWIDTDFRNQELKDYAGGISGTHTAYDDQRFLASAPKAGNGGLGYAVWAPVRDDVSFTYQPYRNAVTTQEWEMADDLGDSNCQSLGQGGALPANSTNQRLVGKIYPEEGTEVTVVMHPSEEGHEIMLALYDLDGNLLSSASGTKDVELTWNATYTGWVAMKIWNVSKNNPSQRAWVKASYQAPKKIADTMGDKADTRASIWTGNAGNSNWNDCKNWEQGKVPSSSSHVVIPDNGDFRPSVSGNVTIASLKVENGGGSSDNPDIAVNGTLNIQGKAECDGTTAFIVGDGNITAGSLDNVVINFEEYPTSVDECEAVTISIYPNPAENSITVTSPFAPKETVVVYDLAGRPVIEQYMDGTIETLDISALTPGTYIVKTGKNSTKLIKL